MDATQQAEEYLRSARQYNSDNAILPSENAVIDRLLADSAEMRRVWIELGKKAKGIDFIHAISGIVSIAAFWSPDKTRELREGKRICDEQAIEIARKAHELAELLDKHAQRCEQFGFSSSIQTHPVDCMSEWASNVQSVDGYLFNREIEPELVSLRARYDFKYWPSISDCLRGIASQQHFEYCDPTTRDALSSREWSKIDFISALRSRIAESDLELTNPSLAAITNCALGLVEDAYTEGSIKKAVQRIKKRDN